jgi:DNA repair protein RecO (recombination protein O)
MNLIRILTAEAQANKNIYKLLENFFTILSYENWVQEYIFWELNLLSYLGYDLEIENLVKKNIVNDKIEYSASSSIEKKIVPNFLIDKNIKVFDNNTLLKGLKLVGDFLEKTVLKPNNLSAPINRVYFISTLK